MASEQQKISEETEFPSRQRLHEAVPSCLLVLGDAEREVRCFSVVTHGVGHGQRVQKQHPVSCVHGGCLGRRGRGWKEVVFIPAGAL